MTNKAMEALVAATQSADFDVDDQSIRLAIQGLTALLGSGGSQSAEQEAFLTTVSHAVICKVASGPGGDTLVRALHVSAVAFALVILERKVKADSFASESIAPSPLALLELLEAATIKNKADVQRADAQAAVSTYTDQKPLFSDRSFAAPQHGTPDAGVLASQKDLDLASVLRPTTFLEIPVADVIKTFRSVALPLANDFASAALHHAIHHEGLVTRILAVCDALLQPLATALSSDRPQTWQGVRKHLSTTSQLLLYLEEILLLQAPVHIASEVEPWLLLIASHLGPIYRAMLSDLQNSGSSNEGAEEGPSELLLVNELLAVAETARASAAVLVNLKALLAATLVDTIGGLEMPDLGTLLEPGSAFSDAHESLPHGGEEPLGVLGSSSELGPSLVSLAVQLMQEVDQELAPAQSGSQAEPTTGGTSDSLTSLGSKLDAQRLIRLTPGEILLEDFQWRRMHSREVLLGLILPPDGKWLDRLVGMLLVNTQHEGVAAVADSAADGPGEDGGAVLAKSPSTKSAPPAREENLFGDLFQEAIGSRGVSEASHRELPLTLHPQAKDGGQGGGPEAAAQIAQFLVGCVFNSQWCPGVFETACSLLRKEHLVAIVTACASVAGQESVGFGVQSLGAGLSGLAEMLTVQDEMLARVPGLMQELAVQLYTQGGRVDSLLAVLAKWILRKEGDRGWIAPGSGETAVESRGAPPSSDGAEAGASLQGLVNTIWEATFQTAGALLGSPDLSAHVLAPSEAESPLEHALATLHNHQQVCVLLLGYYLLKPAGRIELLRRAVRQLEVAVSAAKLLGSDQTGIAKEDEASTLRSGQQLALSRLFLLTGALLCHPDRFPSWLPSQLQSLLASSTSSKPPRKSDRVSFTALLVQKTCASSSGSLVDAALLQGLFLLSKPDELAGSPLSQGSKALTAPPELVSSFLGSLLAPLAAPHPSSATYAELVVDRYLKEVCWRSLWSWPLSALSVSFDGLETTASLAQLLRAAGLTPGPRSLDGLDPVPLLASLWSTVSAGSNPSDAESKTDLEAMSTLTVCRIGLQALQERKNGNGTSVKAEPGQWSDAFGAWLKSKRPGTFLSELCGLLERTVSRYASHFRLFLEECHGAAAAQLVMVLLRARLSDKSAYDGALVKAGVSVQAMRSILRGGHRLLDSQLGEPQTGASGLGVSGELQSASGVGASPIPSEDRALPQERLWEAAVLVPGFPSTAEVSSAQVATCQMLVGALLACIEGMLTLEDCGEAEWPVVERALSRATLSGLLESEGAAIERIWDRHPSFSVENEALRELDQSVKLCENLLDQRLVETPPVEKALPPTSPLGSHLQIAVDAVLLDIVEKLEAILDEANGQGLTILLRYFVVKAPEEPAGFSSVEASGSEVTKTVGVSEPGDSAERGPGRGSPAFLLSALWGGSNSALNVRLLSLLLKVLRPSKEAAASESAESQGLQRGTVTPREQLADVVSDGLRAALLGMGEQGLAAWLKERLLGSSGGSLTWNAPAQQRELAAQLLVALVQESRGTCSSDFIAKLHKALLHLLKPAYTGFDARSVDAYFDLIVHLSSDHPTLIQRTLEVVLDLLDSYSSLKTESITAEHLAHVQRFLGFLGAVFTAAAAVPASQQQSGAPALPEALFRPGRAGRFDRRERSVSRNRAPQVHEAIVESREEGRNDVVREDTEDEEEEDLISFGEEEEEEEVFEGDDETVGTEEDDGFESGESSSDDDDAKLCTFGASGSNFIEQHWYFCYTCDLVVSKGCCSTCARVCHKDHKVVYSKFSRFFCDCGAGGSRTNPCQALRPRGPRSDSSSSFRDQSSAGALGDRASGRGGENASDTGSEAWFEPQGVLQSEAFPKLRVNVRVLAFLEEKGLEGVLLRLCEGFADALGLEKSGLGEVDEESVFDYSIAGGVQAKNDILTFTRAHKYGTFETKLKMEYSSARELKTALTNGLVSKSLLSVSRRGKVAVGEGDKVSLFEAAVLTAASADRGALKALSKNAVRFQIVNLEFNPANDAHLVVSGYEDCQVFVVNARGEVTDRLAVELALEPDTFVVQAGWVPASQVELMVVTNRSVKIYDLSKDKISPVFYVTIPQESIKQAVLARDPEGCLVLIALSQQGVLFLGKLSPQEGSQGSISLTERLQLPPERKWPGSRGCSLSYFTERQTLVSSYEDGQVVIGRLADSLLSFEKVCFLAENERSGNMHFWRAVNEGSGVYVATNSPRQGAAVAVQLGRGAVGTQVLRQMGGPLSLRMEGIATYVAPGSGQRCSVLILNDDGGLQVFCHAPLQTNGSSTALPSGQALGKDPVDRRVPQTSATASFPLTFFENTQCITQNVTWGGDLGDSDAIKLSLAAEESFLEGPTSRPFSIVVTNPSAERVMVGCRIHVGTTGRAHVPSKVHVFDRTLVLEEGVRRWYDIPFTIAEALTADRTFTLTVGSAPNNQLPRIDSFEVYARTKEDFGWREKLESMRDNLQQNRTVANVSTSGPAEAPAVVPVSPVEEGLCAGLEVLGLFYGRPAAGTAIPSSKPISSPRLSGHEHFEDAVEEQPDASDEPTGPSSDQPITPSTSCLTLLKKAFAAPDPHPSIHSYAQHVLTALHPRPEELQRAKDALLMDAFAASVAPCARVLAQGGHRARNRAAQLLKQRVHWAAEIAAQHFEHFGETVGRQGPAFVRDLVGAFETVVAKEALEAGELSALTVDFVEVLCGCAQQALVGERAPSVEIEVGGHIGGSDGVGGDGALQDLLLSGLAAKGTGAAPSVEESGVVGPQPGAENKPQGAAPEEGDVSRTGRERAQYIMHVLQQLLFSPQESVRSAASVALSSHLLQSKLATPASPLQPLGEEGPTQEIERAARGVHTLADAVQFSCDSCSVCPIVERRWHCSECPDFDLCERCYEGRGNRRYEQHLPDHQMVCLPVANPLAMPNPRSVAEALSHTLSDDEADEVGGAAATRLDRPAENVVAEAASSAANEGLHAGTLAMEELSEEESLRLALELSMQESQSGHSPGAPASSLGHQAAGNSHNQGHEVRRDASADGAQSESGRLSGIPTEDSQPAFRKMLLDRFATDVGWMRRCSGLEGVPILQLLARLVSERLPSGALGLAGFDVRRLVDEMLRELNLAVPLPVETRSEWGEVAVLALKFFAFVIKDWELADGEFEGQKGRKRTESGRVSAKHSNDPKDVLRKQAVLDYLFGILQNLMPEFAKPKREKSGGTGHDHQGALLHSRQDKSLSTLQPFFPDSYTRVHGRNVFAEFPKLGLSAAVDLAEALTDSGLKIKAGASTGDAGKALGGPLVDVLCSYIYCPQTHFVRDSARHVLLHACGSDKAAYNLARDNWLLGKELQQLQRLADKSEGFQRPLSHDRSVKLVKCLGVLAETAEKRPHSWQWFCSAGSNSGALSFLLQASYFLIEEAVLQVLKMLALALAEAKDDVSRPSAEFLLGEPAELDRFVRFFMLDYGAKAVRAQARVLLQNAWLRAEGRGQRDVLLTSLVATIPQLSSYGTNLLEMSGLLTWIFGGGADGKSKSGGPATVQAGVSSAVLEALRAHNRLLESHPNGRAYATLQSLIDFDGYYLESEPCSACNNVEAPFAKLKLESLKQETKYTDNRILVRCPASYTIESFNMHVHDARRSKSCKTLRLYYNNRAASDLSELKGSWGLWKKVKSYHLAPNQAELKAELTVPVTGCNFMFEFAELYENLQASSLEHLQCPRCSRHVTDRHGICPHCHENCFQCRQCRNINYENLDSFLCNECGYSKYGRFEFSVNAKPSFAFDAIESEDDMQKCLAVIEKESENAHKQYQQLLATKKPLLRLISSVGDGSGDPEAPAVTFAATLASSASHINQNVAVLGVLYGSKCKDAFQQVSRSVQALHGARKALTAYLERTSSGAGSAQARVLPSAPKRPPSRCYGCASTFVTHALAWLHLLADAPGEKQKMVDDGLVQELFESGIHHCSHQVRASTRVLICTLVRNNAAASKTLTSLIRQRLSYCLDHPRTTGLAVQAKNDCQLLRDACSLNDASWEPFLKLAFEILFKGVQVGTDSPPIAENVILPCLRIVAHACQVPPVGPVAADARGPQSADRGTRSTSPMIGGLTQAFSNRGEGSTAGGLQGLVAEQRSFAQVASAAANQDGTRGSQWPSVSGPQPARPPPARPAPLLVAPESYRGPRQERSEKGVPSATYKEWSKGSVSFETFTQRQQQESRPGTEPLRSQPRGYSAPIRLQSSKPHPDDVARRALVKWRGARARRQLGALDKDSWLKGLLLSGSSAAIRTEACALARTLSTSGSPARKLRFLDLTTELLPLARDVRAEAAVEFFTLYQDLLAEEDGRLYLTVKGWLGHACGLIVVEVRRIRAQEGNYLMANVNEGFVLRHVIGLLQTFLEVRTIRRKFVSEGLLMSLLEALLSLKSLVIQKTKLTASCAQELSGLLETLLETGDDTQRSFVRACVIALQGHTGKRDDERGGQRAATFIMNQLCDVIQPVRPEPVYLLTLNKAHTQEEFIRGSMAQNPYSSDDVGPLMRDVKNKICTQLEMLGLIEDDYGMELLVAGSIVSLDLSIKQVFEKVWLRTQQAVGVVSVADCPPMSVTYRLQGLDGEATEPMISEVDADRGQQQDPEVEFALTGEMDACGGLELLLQILRESPQGRAQGELGALLKLLGFCCKVRTNRRTLLRLDALHVLLDRARAAVSVSSTEQDGTAEALLEIIESLVTEANEMAAGGLEKAGSVTQTAASVTAARGRIWAGEAREDEAVAAVKMFLEKLSYRPAPVQGGRNAPESRGVKQKDGKSQADAVARILPYLTYGEPAAMECLIGHFAPFMDFTDFDRFSAEGEAGKGTGENAGRAADIRQRLESFVKVCESIRLDVNGDILKTLFLERGLVAGALHYLKGVFPPVNSAGAAALEIRSSPAFTKALLLPSVPIVLGMLTGLANGHAPIQGLVEKEGVLPLLHALEGVSSEQKEIRAKAEGVLDIVSDEASGGTLTACVNALRQATKDELRVRAMKRREAMLKGLGMASAVTSDGADRIVVSAKPRIEGLDEMEEEEEDGLSCMVCREGYKLKPAECLGTYTFSKRVNGGGMLGARSEYIYTTVSHFNVIHFTCHQEAKRADSKLKAPKKEWEGAVLRNSETLTNAIFPLRGPDVAPQNYSRYCDQYWENLASLGRADGSRFKLLAHDLASLLGRFASGGSLSVDSHGGSKESNSQLLPFMVQMGAYLVEQVGSSQRRTLRKSLHAFLGVQEASRTPGVGTPLSTSRRSSFADAPSSTTPSSSTPELASTPGGSSLPPRSPAPAVVRSLDESVHLMLVLSLLLHSFKEWQKYRREFLQRGIQFACGQHRENRPLMPVPPSPSPGSLTDLSSLLTEGPLSIQTKDGGFDPRAAFEAAKPIAILVALVDKLQKFFKKGGAAGGAAARAAEQESRPWTPFTEPGSSPGQTPEEELSFSFSRGSPTPRSPVSATREASPLQRAAESSRDAGAQRSPSRRASGDESGDQSWELVMKERLNNIPAMLAFAKEFQELVEDLHAAEDLMELLDVAECLGDIYDQSGGGSWEEFLEQTVMGVTPRGSAL